MADQGFSVFDAFPKPRFAFLEVGCAWVPTMMDRQVKENLVYNNARNLYRIY